jgi:Flp pilus assembly pilin Flp
MLRQGGPVLETAQLSAGMADRKGHAMPLNLKRFAKDDSGAVTVDWVVLSAAVIGLGMVVLVPIAYSSGSSAQGISDYISGLTVGYDNQ